MGRSQDVNNASSKEQAKYSDQLRQLYVLLQTDGLITVGDV